MLYEVSATALSGVAAQSMSEKSLSMTIKYKIQVTESLAKQIAENICSAIVEGRLEVDERLPTEEELARRFGVSRPTIREALKRLAAQNLVRSRRGPGGGTFVNKPSLKEQWSSVANAMTLMVSVGEIDLAEITEARHELELICCRLAAERRDDTHLAEMKKELETQKDSGLTDTDFCASDVRFHRALVNATQNPVLQFVMIAVLESLQPVANLLVFRFRERELIISQHERLYEAVKDGDADAAIAVWNEQIAYLGEKYAEAQEWRRERDQAS